VGIEPAAFVLGTRRDSTWGANVWVEDAGSAGSDPEALRLAYASAAAQWADEGRTSHYVVVPATDVPIVDAWFRLSFGLQHVHALREAPALDFQPAARPDIKVRPAKHSDMARLVELDVAFPQHSATSPIFSPIKIPMPHESRQEIEQDLTDARFSPFVVEHAGRIIGTATAASIEVSNSNTKLMRPPSCGFLGFAVVDPEARGLGAGRALADAVLAWSRDQGYEWVATDWRSTNLQADRTWRAAGFRPSFLRLHRKIA
jgi:GNAT superfamily N-acetyltransferase